MSGKLPTSIMATSKERNKSQIQSEGSPEFVLEISLAAGWGFP